MPHRSAVPGTRRVIVIAPGVTGPLYLPAAGGTPQVLTQGPGSSETHHWPFFLPDGKHFLYFVNWSGPANARHDGLYVASLDSQPHSLSPNYSNVVFASSACFTFRDRSVRRNDPNDWKQPVRNSPGATEVEYSVSIVGVDFRPRRMVSIRRRAPSRVVWYDSAEKGTGAMFPCGPSRMSGPQFVS